MNRLLCEILASAAPKPEIREALHDLKAVDAVIRSAAREQLLPALHEAVVRHFSAEISKLDRMVLAVAHENNRRRNRMIRDLLVEIGLAAQHRGFDLIALKGGHWILEDTEGFAPWRWMLDVDILVEPENYDQMPELLAGLGYAPASPRPQLFRQRRERGHYHLPPHTRSGLPTFIEVHRHAGWRPDLMPTELMFAQRRVVAPGLAVAQPWCAAGHAIVHWLIQHDALRRREGPLRAVFDVARHLERSDIDFDQLIWHAERVGMRPEIDVAVAFTIELFGVQAPAGLTPSKAACRHVARCLAARHSPKRAWIARERAGVLAMWDCKRSMYRCYLRNYGPVRTLATLWSNRLIRAPLMIVRAFQVIAITIAKLPFASKAPAP